MKPAVTASEPLNWRLSSEVYQACIDFFHNKNYLISMAKDCNYLGVDFGTSNCMACAINSEGKLEFAKLEGDNHLLPTVLFVPRVDFLADNVDEGQLDKRFKKAKEEERNRYLTDLAEIQKILETYDGINKPKYPERPQKPRIDHLRSNTLELNMLDSYYENNLNKYQEQIAHLEVSLEKYQVKRKAYADNLRSSIRAVASDDVLKKSVLVAMQREASEEAEEKYWNQTFFSAMVDGRNFVFGRKAINMYAEDPMGGFFMRSPKSFLATELKAEYSDTFIKIIEKILTHIKTQSEKTFNIKFNGIVLGRPINYHGTRAAAGNENALYIMRCAARNAGFDEVKFFFEPVAAALSIDEKSQSLTSLIVDIGGGTTDCALIRHETSDAKDSIFHLLSSNGTRVGGTDFDQDVAWSLLMPHFGKGSFLINNLPLPNGILYDSISTRDLPAQIRFRKSEHAINDLLKQSGEKVLLKRFQTLHKQQAQHKLLLEAERLKIIFSSNPKTNINLDFAEIDFRPEVHSEEFVISITKSISQVLDVVRNTIRGNDSIPEVVYVTGGMSQSPFLVRALVKEFDQRSEIIILDSLSAVGSGLGLVAHGLTENQKVDHYARLGLSE